MSHYELTYDAQQDLINIRRYTIKTWGDEQSKRYLSGLVQVFGLILAFPAIGKRCETDDVFYFLYKSHAIYYTLSASNIIVIAVFHQSMIPQKHLQQRSFSTHTNTPMPLLP